MKVGASTLIDLERLFSLGAPAPAPPGGLPTGTVALLLAVQAEALARWVGTYRDAEGTAWAMQLEDGQLTLRHPGGAYERFSPCSPHEFFLDQPFLRASFRPLGPHHGQERSPLPGVSLRY